MRGQTAIDKKLSYHLKFFEEIDRLVDKPIIRPDNHNYSKFITKGFNIPKKNNKSFSSKINSPQNELPTKSTGEISNLGNAINKFSTSSLINNFNNVESTNFNEFSSKSLKLTNNSSSKPINNEKNFPKAKFPETKIAKISQKNQKIKKSNENSKIPLKKIYFENETDNIWFRLYDDGINKKKELKLAAENLSRSNLYSHHPEITTLAMDLELNPKDVMERLYPKNKINENRRKLKKIKNKSSLNISMNKSQNSNKSNSILQTSHVAKLSFSLSKVDFYKKFRADSKVKSSVEEIFHPVLSKNSLIIAARKGSSFERLTNKKSPKKSKTTRNSLNISKIISVSNISIISHKTVNSQISINMGQKLFERAKISQRKKNDEILRKNKLDETEYLKYSYAPNFSKSQKNQEKIKENPHSQIYERQSIWEQNKQSRLQKIRNNNIEKEDDSFNHHIPNINHLDICDDEAFIKRNLNQILAYVERKQKANLKKKEQENRVEKMFGYGKNYVGKPTVFQEFNLSKKKDKFYENDLNHSSNLEVLNLSRRKYRTNEFFENKNEVSNSNSLFDDFDDLIENEKRQFQRNKENSLRIKYYSNNDYNRRKSSPDRHECRSNRYNQISPRSYDSNQINRMTKNKSVEKKQIKSRYKENEQNDNYMRRLNESKSKENKKSPESRINYSYKLSNKEIPQNYNDKKVEMSKSNIIENSPQSRKNYRSITSNNSPQNNKPKHKEMSRKNSEKISNKEIYGKNLNILSSSLKIENQVKNIKCNNKVENINKNLQNKNCFNHKNKDFNNKEIKNCGKSMILKDSKENLFGIKLNKFK